jgi:GH18 family chitinase
MNRGIYGRKFPPQQIPFQHLTHINYAFANINKESGTVALSDTWADVEVSPGVFSPVRTGSNFISREMEVRMLMIDPL